MDIFDIKYMSKYFESPYDEQYYTYTLRHGAMYPTKRLIPKDNGKFREVYAYPEMTKRFFKILNRALIQEVPISNFSYAYKPKMAISKPIQKAREAFDKNCYSIKIDISKYFNTVNIAYLENKIFPMLFSTKESVDFISKCFRNTKCYFKDEIIDEMMGIQPGNPMSSFLANFVLDNIDRKVADLVYSYIRYSDDILISDENYDTVNNAFKVLSESIAEVGLTLNPDKVHQFSPKEPVSFLGAVIDSNGVGLTANKKKAFKRTVKHAIKITPKTKDFGENVNNCFYWVVNSLFAGAVYDDLSAGIGGFICNNCTNQKDMDELNAYLIQEFKVLKTGKYNKATWSKTSLKELTTYGFLDWHTICRKFRNNKHFFIQYIYDMYISRKPVKEFNYMEPIPVQVEDEDYIDSPDYFIDILLDAVIYKETIEGYPSKYLNVNPIAGDVYIANIKLVSGYKICKDSVQVGNCKFIIEDTSVECPMDSFDDKYLGATYIGYSMQKTPYKLKLPQQKKYIRPMGTKIKYKYSDYSDRQRELMFLIYLLGYYRQIKKTDRKYTVVHTPDASIIL